jgi:aspartokinase
LHTGVFSSDVGGERLSYVAKTISAIHNAALITFLRCNLPRYIIDTYSPLAVISSGSCYTFLYKDADNAQCAARLLAARDIDAFYTPCAIIIVSGYGMRRALKEVETVVENAGASVFTISVSEGSLLFAVSSDNAKSAYSALCCAISLSP